MSTNLYIPMIRPVQPAFSGDTMTIYFSLPYNGVPSQINCRILDPTKSSINGQNEIFTKNNLTASLDAIENEYKISITDIELANFIENQIYQIQIQNGISAWSQASLIKKVPAFSLEDNGLNKNLYPLDTLVLTGMIKDNETVFLKECSFVSAEGRIVQGTCIGQSFTIPMKAFFKNNDNSSVSGTLILETTDGYVQKSNKTISLLNWSDDEEKLFLIGELLSSIGAIKISSPISLAGTVLRKEKNKHLWTIVGYMNGTEWIDASIEGGKFYEYYILNESNLVVGEVQDIKNDMNESCETDFSDMYLSDMDTMLIVKFNPSISNIKYVTQESITNTLGGKYPIIRKNGETKYKQFTISGLLYLDYYTNENLVCSNQIELDNYSSTNDIWYSDEGSLLLSSENSLGDLKSYSIKAIEKILRQKTEEFLVNNKPKIFRSYDEGPMIIHLSNISFTPNKQLNNHIYDFSAQVTEICDFSSDNIEKYNLGPVSLSQFFINKVNSGGS